MEDSFYLTITIIAAVILILSLTYVGVLLYSTKSTVAFPPTQSKCPDYWTIDTSGKCKVPTSTNDKNASGLTFNGSPGITRQLDKTTNTIFQYGISSVIDNTTAASPANTAYSLMDVSDASWNNLTIGGVNAGNALCNKARWARGANIVWDGISNTNQC
jgi:hypothetical protein